MEPPTKKKTIYKLGLEDFTRCGLPLQHSITLLSQLKDAVVDDARATWRRIVARNLLNPCHPHALHQLLYCSVYSHYDQSIHGPPVYWFPSLHESRCSNLGRIMERHGPRLLGALYKDPITSFKQFQQCSVQHPEICWQIILNEISVQFSVPPKCILDTSDKSKRGRTWLPGAMLNIADCCLRSNSYLKKQDDSLAVVWRDEGYDGDQIHNVKRMT